LKVGVLVGWLSVFGWEVGWLLVFGWEVGWLSIIGLVCMFIKMVSKRPITSGSAGC